MALTRLSTSSLPPPWHAALFPVPTAVPAPTPVWARPPPLPPACWWSPLLPDLSPDVGCVVCLPLIPQKALSRSAHAPSSAQPRRIPHRQLLPTPVCPAAPCLGVASYLPFLRAWWSLPNRSPWLPPTELPRVAFLTPAGAAPCLPRTAHAPCSSQRRDSGRRTRAQLTGQPPFSSSVFQTRLLILTRTAVPPP